MGLSGREREIVTALVETKAVDFESVGKVLAQFGPTMALDMDFEDRFCGTMRTFFHCYIEPPWVRGIPQPGEAPPESV